MPLTSATRAEGSWIDLARRLFIHEVHAYLEQAKDPFAETLAILHRLQSPSDVRSWWRRKTLLLYALTGTLRTAHRRVMTPCAMHAIHIDSNV